MNGVNDDLVLFSEAAVDRAPGSLGTATAGTLWPGWYAALVPPRTPL